MEMKMIKDAPTKAGWYWAIHSTMGLVVTHVQICDGVVYVMDNGYGGWNPLICQFTEFSDSPIAAPMDCTSGVSFPA